MRIIAIALGVLCLGIFPAFTWEYWETKDEFNGLFKRSCVYDKALWETDNNHVNFCIVRSMKFNDLNLFIGLDGQDQLCSGEIHIRYKIDGGEAMVWEGELRPVSSPLGSVTFVVLEWDPKKITSLVRGNKILFRLRDDCNSFLDLSFDIRGKPHRQVMR